MIYGYTPILKIPPDKRFHRKTLEESIREDFGEAGLAKFKEWDLALEVPPYGDFGLGVSGRDELKSIELPIESAQIGWVYNISMDRVHGIRTELPVLTNYHRSSISSVLLLTFDLNPEVVNPRYLRLAFDTLQRLGEDE